MLGLWPSIFFKIEIIENSYAKFAIFVVERVKMSKKLVSVLTLSYVSKTPIERLNL